MPPKLRGSYKIIKIERRYAEVPAPTWCLNIQGISGLFWDMLGLYRGDIGVMERNLAITISDLGL